MKGYQIGVFVLVCISGFIAYQRGSAHAFYDASELAMSITRYFFVGFSVLCVFVSIVVFCQGWRARRWPYATSRKVAIVMLPLTVVSSVIMAILLTLTIRSVMEYSTKRFAPAVAAERVMCVDVKQTEHRRGTSTMITAMNANGETLEFSLSTKAMPPCPGELILEGTRGIFGRYMRVKYGQVADAHSTPKCRRVKQHKLP